MLITMLGIASIVIGFFCIATAFVAVMRKKPVWIPVTLGITSLIFVTVVPVTLAIFFAAQTPS
ncbi:hypothetical protein B841_12350 [Corynebacterium maris DSM 45190]|uniref:Uncharacterized protein n=1 Tax=Corynebacterium maris DSM 45190 TaxID=1224163 RepID=S5SXS5_9CORY|nr:hypothetical protein [Corynebacterium maris]AGS35942.1 hypothetical protein B841_12350 [Corynebacterium maris DSM 45190]